MSQQIKMPNICTILKFYFSNQCGNDGMWTRLWATPQRSSQLNRIINLPTSFKPHMIFSVVSLASQVMPQVSRERRVKLMARRQHNSRMNVWVDECKSAGWSILMSACESICTMYSLCAEGEELLLQVAVDFEAVVARISDHNMSVRGESQSLWAVQRVRWCVDVGQERTAAIKHLRENYSKWHTEPVFCLDLHLW